MGFACGHVFHLGHLLEIVDPGAEVEEEEPAYGGRYLVGMKVMHASLLRDRVGGGCPLCVKR